MNERYRQQPKVDRRYIEIVRDPDLLAVAKAETIDTYEKKYTECYEVISDPVQREQLISMAVSSIDMKWQQAIDEYSQSEIECSDGNSEACKIKPNHEIVLGMFLQVADTERREMGALPFIGDSRPKTALGTENQPHKVFPAPSPEPMTLIDRAAD